MTTQAVRPGRLLAGRYRVENLLDDTDGVQSWRAVDEVLSRAVFVHTLPTDDPRADPVAEAARAASQARDPRFLQVLDVDAEADTVYVVREWVTGQNLTAVLANGPFAADQATALGREVSEALAGAHKQGLTHQLLEPGSVVIAANGSVKVAGLAIEAALRGSPDGDPAENDAAGIGRILYAALTARWPADEGHGLPVAPRIDGRFASPRQVRPGVPRLLDEVVDRTLGNGERHHAGPLTTPAEIADALTASPSASGGRGNGVLADSAEHAWPPPAVIDDPSEPIFVAQASPNDSDRSAGTRTAGRVLGVLGAAVFLVVAFWLGLQLFLSGVTTPDRTAGSTPQPTETEPAEPEPTEEATGEDEPEEDEEEEDEPEPEPEAGISLRAEPSSVQGNQRITLSGQLVPAVDNLVLRVERRIGDTEWEGFPDSNSPVTARTRTDGSFSTWVQTGRQGENEWRLVGTIDGEEVVSEVVTVTVN